MALAVRSPGLLARPRFWAEEAWIYIPAMQEGTLLTALTFVFRKNLQLLTNLFSFGAILVPAWMSAHVTTYLSGAVALYVAFLLGRFVSESEGSRSTAVLAGAFLAFQAAGYEVFLNATNVQWLCALSILLLSQLRLAERSFGFRAANALWVVVCGLTGVPSVVAGLAMLLEAARQRSRWHLVYLGLLGSCGMVQAGVLLFGSEPSARPFALSWDAVSALLMQTVFLHLIGLHAASVFGTRLHDLGAHPAMAGSFFGISLTFLVLLIYLGQSSGTRVFTLVASWLGVTTAYMFGSLGGVADSVSGLAGARYFIFGSTCLMLLLVSIAASPCRFKAVVAQGLLAALLLVAVKERYTGYWTDFVLKGPSVPDQVEACRTARPCPVQVWPTSISTPPLMLRQP